MWAMPWGGARPRDVSIKPVTGLLQCCHSCIAARAANGLRGGLNGCAESFGRPVRCTSVMAA